ncbi:MAG: hypothetical protein M1817_006124 [Caeruleum heppii]|nr:MAG: hypothetical protein M1817_006124 [Caeruleum heppii]
MATVSTMHRHLTERHVVHQKAQEPSTTTNSSSHSVEWPIWIPRLALSLLLGTAVLFPTYYQPIITPIYNYLYHSRFYNLSTFETIWTVLLYVWFEWTYIVKLWDHPERRLDARSTYSESGERIKKEPDLQHPSKRLPEAIVYIVPLLIMDFVMIKKFAGVPKLDIVCSGGYEPTSEADKISASFMNPTLHNFSWEAPLQLIRALPRDAPSSRRIVLELSAAIFMYDSLFFFFHLALHKLPWLKRFHLPHHNHAEIHPQITNQLDIIERLGLVLLANFSLNVIGSHVLTRTLFVALFVYLLMELHCGLDLEWGYEKILPKGWGAGSVKHARHHKTGNGLYEPFFCHWDNAWAWVERRWKT